MKEFNKCDRCGKCCIEIPCFLSKELLNNSEKCPALEYDGTYHSCGLYLKPSKYLDLGNFETWKDRYFSEMIKNLMGIGTFCDSKHSPIDLVKYILGDISNQLADNILWEYTSYPMAQTSIIRKQLTNYLIESNRQKEIT